MSTRAIAGVNAIEHCWIPMPDGVRLSARIWLPEETGATPAPAVLEYIPYRKRDMARARDERNHPVFARAGYVSVRVDMRGSGDSEGLMADMYGDHERDDALEVIAWLARQPWCDGNIGMMGTSWGGTASLQAASRRPDALKAILAVCATDNRFDDDIHHMGGCILTDTVEWGATLLAILASPPDPETLGDVWRDMWMERLEHLTFPLENWVRHETRDAYWTTGSVDETPEAIACPMLLVGGWSDRYSNTVINLLERDGAQSWGIVGPWGHHYPDVASPGPGIDFQSVVLRWWDRWLRGIDNGVDGEPRLRVWMQEYDPPVDRIPLRSGSWKSLRHVAGADREHREYRLCSSGLSLSPCQDGGGLDVPWDLEAGAQAGDTGYFGRVGGLPLSQEASASCLMLQSEPLDVPFELLGRARLSAIVTCDQPVATLIARLIDVPPGGEPARVSYGVANLALEKSGREASGLRRGEPHRVDLDFHNKAYRFAEGHRVCLAISSSYWPLIWPSPNRAGMQVHAGASQLRLPSAGRELSDMQVCFGGPCVADTSDRFVVTSEGPLERGVSESGDRRVVWWHQPEITTHMRDIDLAFGYETRAEHGVSGNDPTSACSAFEHRMMWRRADWHAEVASRASLCADRNTYLLDGEVVVREDGKEIFRLDWSPVVPRTCS